jgi:hypothetical protein
VFTARVRVSDHEEIKIHLNTGTVKNTPAHSEEKVLHAHVDFRRKRCRFVLNITSAQWKKLPTM